MTECQGCGAWNDISRTLCVLCGTPLAETDEWDAAAELPPLPPLPDGGLAASMPVWLREPPSANADVQILAPAALAAAPAAELAQLGPRADPRTFLTDDDFPRWLRDLAARRDEAARVLAAAATSDAAAPAPSSTAANPLHPANWPNWPGTPASLVATTVGADDAASAGPSPGPAQKQTPGSLAARVLHGHDRRALGPWETLLLVVLFLGVVIAALWALVSNGVFSPGL